MTPSQRDHILAVIERDADGRGRLASWDDEPRFCILGGLAVEAGFPISALQGKLEPNQVRAKVNGLTLIQILKGLGIDKAKRNQLMGANDGGDYYATSEEQHKTRRARLRDLVNSWPVLSGD